MPTPSACPCGSSKPITTCCEPFILGRSLPLKPEQLMRSRYTAFVLCNAEYLIATHWPTTRPANLAIGLNETFNTSEWLGMRVLAAPEPKNNQGEVEFAAFYRDNQQTLRQIHERSSFTCEDDKWFYVDGKFLPDVKLSRNDPCLCGSGRKYKKCCGQ